MEVSVLNIKGQDTGKKVVLNDAIFGIEPNDHVIYLAVNQYLAAQRKEAKLQALLANWVVRKVAAVHVVATSSLRCSVVVAVFLDHAHVTIGLNLTRK